ncbi:hypothetical protein D3C72_1571340 [compost metagenome]
MVNTSTTVTTATSTGSHSLDQGTTWRGRLRCTIATSQPIGTATIPTYWILAHRIRPARSLELISSSRPLLQIAAPPASTKKARTVGSSRRGQVAMAMPTLATEAMVSRRTRG